MTFAFVLYAVMFSFALVMMVRSMALSRWDEVAMYAVVAGYLFIGLCGLLHWSDIGNPFGNRLRLE